MHINCPHCQNPIEVVGDQRAEVVCPSCGSSINLDAGRTRTFLPGAVRHIGKFTLLEHLIASRPRRQAARATRELDQVRIKGRRDPTRAFELISLKVQVPSARVELLGTFLTGLSAFRNRDYAAALAMFRECRNRSPEDGPTLVYIDRSERELTKGPATKIEP